MQNVILTEYDRSRNYKSGMEDELRLSDTAVKQSGEGLLICAYCEIKLVNCAVVGSQVSSEKAGEASF